MWASTPAEWSAMMDGCMERLEDNLLGAGIICSVVCGVMGESRAPGSFIDPDYADAVASGFDSSPLAVHAAAMKAATERARAEYESWERRLAMARLPPP